MPDDVEEDDDHLPAIGHPQLTPEELAELLHNWPNVRKVWADIHKERDPPETVLARLFRQPTYMQNQIAAFMDRVTTEQDLITDIENRFIAMLTLGWNDAYIHTISPRQTLMVYLEITPKFGFILPQSGIADALRRLHLPLVSVGAGLGFLETLLQHDGIDVIATDPHPPSIDPTPNRYFRQDPFCHIEPIDALTAIARYPDRSIFCAFPDHGDWAYQMAEAIHPGQSLIYIGEGMGGCCASDAFFQYLHAFFTLETAMPILNWFGINNSFQVWRKI